MEVERWGDRMMVRVERWGDRKRKSQKDGELKRWEIET